MPVGLHKGDGPDSTVLTLVRQVGVVTIPGSGIATFTLGKDLVAAYGGYRGYCVAVPLNGEVDGCQF